MPAAVAAAGSPAADAVLAAVRGREFAGPAGLIRIDPDNLHAWRPWMIGRIDASGRIQVVDRSPAFVRPVPFPDTRERPDWERFLSDLKLKWGGKWEAPPDR